jgi:hypothetical protein
MAFTFCTEKEFPYLVNRWKRTSVPKEATDRERGIYGAAFMPHLE